MASPLRLDPNQVGEPITCRRTVQLPSVEPRRSDGPAIPVLGRSRGHHRRGPVGALGQGLSRRGGISTLAIGTGCTRRRFRGQLGVCARGGSNRAVRMINLVREWPRPRLPSSSRCRGSAIRKEETANRSGSPNHVRMGAQVGANRSTQAPERPALWLSVRQISASGSVRHVRPRPNSCGGHRRVLERFLGQPTGEVTPGGRLAGCPRLGARKCWVSCLIRSQLDPPSVLIGQSPQGPDQASCLSGALNPQMLGRSLGANYSHVTTGW